VIFCCLGSYTEFWSDLSFSNPNDFTVIFPLVASFIRVERYFESYATFYISLRILDMVEGSQNDHAFTYVLCSGA
jgi:hypothetical protein